MESVPRLDCLPPEILLEIVRYLPFELKHHLRLVNRQLAQILYPDMSTYKKIIATSRKSLETFIAMTEPGQAGCLVTDLVINEVSHEDVWHWRTHGVVNGESELEGEENNATGSCPSLLELLVRVFTNLCRNTEIQGLQSLRLSGRSCRFAGNLLSDVAHALQASRLPLNEITSELDGNTWGHVFVLGCDRLATILKEFDLSASFENLQCLSLHFAPTEDCSQWRDRMKFMFTVEGCHDMDTTWYTSIFTLLDMCPSLEELHLYGYHAWGTAQVGLLDRIVERYPDLELGKIGIQGFGTADGELSRFLRHYSKHLWDVNIEALLLTKDELEDLFLIISTDLPELQRVWLDNLEVVGPKDPALLRSPEYFKRRSTDVRDYHSSDYRTQIDLVYFDDEDRPEEERPNSFERPNWNDGEISEPIAWRTNRPGHAVNRGENGEYYDWLVEMNQKYGGVLEVQRLAP